MHPEMHPMEIALNARMDSLHQELRKEDEAARRRVGSTNESPHRDESMSEMKETACPTCGVMAYPCESCDPSADT